MTPKLKVGELEQVIKLVGRSPSCYPPGTLEALKCRRPTPAPEPVAITSTSARPAARIRPDAEHRGHEHRLASLRVHATQSAPEPERAAIPPSYELNGSVNVEIRRMQQHRKPNRLLDRPLILMS